ncbi:MAG: flavodoxin [Ruminococcus sp.]|nr:flavodoxin [Ruminococcus sp.]
MKAAIVFWSGTCNTEAMAKAVAQGIKAVGAEADIMKCDEFNETMIDDYDAIAFGCPSMGAEQLEEDEFEPMFSGCAPKLGGKKIALFGSYGWGNGEWMRNWQDECERVGAVLACNPVICMDSPDDEAVAACEALGKSLIN